MNPRIKLVQALENYMLAITFNNGEEKYFDVQPYLEIGVFKSLKNSTMFSTAKAEYGTVIWQNGVDFDPDTLYLESKPNQPEEQVG